MGLGQDWVSAVRLVCSTPSATACRTSSESLRGEARLTEANVEAALREIRMALLEADVNFKVVKAFVDRVRDRAMGQDVLRSLTPAQQVVRIVRDEMIALFGDAQGGLPPSSARRRASSCCSACRARARRRRRGSSGAWLTRQGRHPMLVSTDVRRPAAIQQLNVLGQKAGAARVRPGGRDGPGRARAGRAGRGAQPRLRRRHRRHRGPPAHRRRADDGAAGDQGGGRADRPALRRRRDDGPGRDQERRRVQPPHGRHRRRADASSTATRAAARRCRSWRSSACRSRLSAAASGSRTSSRSTPTASCRGCSAWATCCRSSRRPSRRSTDDEAERLEAEDPARRLHARGLPRPAADDPEDGAAREHPRDDARAWAT